MSNPSTFRRTVAGICLIAGPLLLLVGGAVTPSEGSDGPSAYMKSVAADPGAHEWGTVAFVLGFALLVPGLVGAVHLLRHRAVVLGHVFGSLAILGAVMFTALASTTFYDIAIASSLPLDQATKVNDAVEDVSGAGIVLIPALFGTFVGLIGTAIALWRGGWTPAWVAAAGAGGMILVVIGDGNQALGIAGSVALLVGYGYVGLQMLRMGNDAWERATPPASEADIVATPGSPAPATGV